jgi:hypothetical protein
MTGILDLLAQATNPSMEGGVLGGLAVVCVQGAFSLAKKALGRNGEKNGDGNGQARLCREHAERLASLEACHESLRADLKEHREAIAKVHDCVKEILLAQKSGSP